MPVMTSKQKEGKFIVFEGIDGSGSTSLGRSITTYLRSRDREVTFTHEPSDGPMGQIIRLALQGRLIGGDFDLSDDIDKLGSDNFFNPHTLALLYGADRADHTYNKILPSINNGNIVVCDRYLLSSLAYQGVSLDLDWILEVNRPAVTPDLTIFLDATVESAEERLRKDRWKKDIFEDKSSLKKVRERYLEIIKRDIAELGEIKKVDVNISMDSVVNEVKSIVKNFLDISEDDGSGKTCG